MALQRFYDFLTSFFSPGLKSRDQGVACSSTRAADEAHRSQESKMSLQRENSKVQGTFVVKLLRLEVEMQA